MSKIEFGRERLSSGSEVVAFNGVSFVSYDKVLFYDVNFRVHKGEVVSVTGETGSGKSVLLQLATGRLQPNEGSIRKNGKANISYVPQNISQIDVDKNTTIRNFYYSARNLTEIAKKKISIETSMSSGKSDQKLLNQYGDILEEFERRGGYVADVEIEQILEGLQISKRLTGHIGLDTKISEVSSGQHTRLLIGRALFSTADLLVLDDPTSHLDVDSVAWLAEFLKNRDQGVLIGTQNVKFSEACANRIVEITDFGRVMSFQGKYSDYVIKRDSMLEAERKAAYAARKKFEKLESTFLKFKNAGYFKRSKDFAQVGSAMQSRLERMQDELSEMPGAREIRQNKVKEQTFQPGHENINPSIRIKGVRKSYDRRHTALDIRNVDITVKRGQILVIKGDNGSGKSTLLRTIKDTATGENKFLPDNGEIYVEKGLTIGYNAPDFLGIPSEGSVFELVLNSLPRRNEAQATGILTFFGFDSQNLRLRTIETISSGEKKQLALARIMAQHPDILLLDEPTDNLKIDVINRLITAIKKYKGTTILIAHDSEFLKKLDTNIELRLPSGKVTIRRSLR